MAVATKVRSKPAKKSRRKTKKKSTALAKRSAAPAPRYDNTPYSPKDKRWWTPRRTEVVRNLYAKNADDDQFEVFKGVAMSLNLSPLAKQIYCVVRDGEMAIQTGIDGLRLIAQRTEQYRGRTEPEWCSVDGIFKKVLGPKDALNAARIGVKREGFTDPVYAVVYLSEYFNSSSFIWGKMPRNQLIKCAEAQALRACFPQELSGLYAHEEMPDTAQVSSEEADERNRVKYEKELQTLIRKFYFVGRQAGYKDAELETRLKKKYKINSHNDASLEQLKEAIATLAEKATRKATRRGKLIKPEVKKDGDQKGGKDISDAEVIEEDGEGKDGATAQA